MKKFREILEASAQARANKTQKNMMDASRGARHQLSSPTPLSPEDTGHKTRQQMNKSIGRALRRESLDESKEYDRPEEGHKVKVIAKGMEHSGKTGTVHQISPAGTHVGIKDKKGNHMGYYHLSDVKHIED